MSLTGKNVDSRSLRVFVMALSVLMLMVAFSLSLVACGDDEDDKVVDDTKKEEKGEITIGWIPWDECIAATYLWKAILEDEGYTVKLTQLDVAPVYAGLAEGDLDLFLDAWLPTTHEDYWEEFGDKLEDITIWYDKGTLELAVPEYVEEINSIADLKGNADMFGGKIIGIEPGAGLMRLTREAIMPGYELEDYELVEGSTPAMLAELDRATRNEEPIVVTLWHPHWAYASYDIKDLEDPQGLFGDAENLHVVARSGFKADFPEVAKWLANFEMTDDALAELELLVIEEYGAGSEEKAVEEWLKDSANRRLVDSWIGK